VRHSKKAEKAKRDKEYAERENRRKLRKLDVVEEIEIDAENKKYDQFCKATEQLFQIIDTTLLKCYLQVCTPLISLGCVLYFHQCF
jgi:hypothetical protein